LALPRSPPIRRRRSPVRRRSAAQQSERERSGNQASHPVECQRQWSREHSNRLHAQIWLRREIALFELGFVVRLGRLPAVRFSLGFGFDLHLSVAAGCGLAFYPSEEHRGHGSALSWRITTASSSTTNTHGHALGDLVLSKTGRPVSHAPRGRRRRPLGDATRICVSRSSCHADVARRRRGTQRRDHRSLRWVALDEGSVNNRIA
jgi:hypothetical protein